MYFGVCVLRELVRRADRRRRHAVGCSQTDVGRRCSRLRALGVDVGRRLVARFNSIVDRVLSRLDIDLIVRFLLAIVVKYESDNDRVALDSKLKPGDGCVCVCVCVCCFDTFSTVAATL